MKILLHSSKTMKVVPCQQAELTMPLFVDRARELNETLAQLDITELISMMKVSDKLAKEVHEQIEAWRPDGELSPAALTFRGDIYSGLRAQGWDDAAREYASEHLWILSGLYGILRPFDGIWPYRLEMGYPLRIDEQGLYEYWNQALASLVSAEDVFVNITANEYLRGIKQSLGHATIITPKFLTISPKTSQPIFVTVHAKIARGAFANWMITHQIQDLSRLHEFNDLGYQYDEALSTEEEPVFVCKEFGGIGLSMRLS